MSCTVFAKNVLRDASASMLADSLAFRDSYAGPKRKSLFLQITTFARAESTDGCKFGAAEPKIYEGHRANGVSI